MAKPVISFFISSIRTNCWMNLYDSLKNTSVPFEIVFCGDVKPDFKTPKNIKFIYSETKPSQCFHIAQKYTEGDFVALVADDCVFSPRSLDNIMRHFNKKGYDNTVLLNRLIYDKKVKVYEEKLNFFGAMSNTEGYNPLVGSGFFMSKASWDSIGGIDSRFLALYWDLDIMMRAHCKNFQVHLCNDVISTEIMPKGRRSSMISSSNSAKDIIFTYSLWCVKKNDIKKRYSYNTSIADSRRKLRHLAKKDKLILLKERSMDVVGFENKENLLLVSQGSKGKWK